MNVNVQQPAGAALGAIEAVVENGWDKPFSELIDRLPVAAYACDATGRILWFNAQATRLWGRAPRMGTTANSIVALIGSFLTDT